jgi:hypothetical protein
MANRSSKLVDVECVVRRETEKGLAVADGSTETITMAGGRKVTREKMVWLPKALVEVNADDGTVTMPEWLAVEKGLV